MKALSLWQPWASLVALQLKRVETRGWTTDYRGPLAIHAAKRPIPRDFGEFAEEKKIAHVLAAYGVAWRTLPLGVVLCTVDLFRIERTSVIRGDLSETERIFGDYTDCRYAWFFQDVKRFETPIPAKGNRLLWNWQEKT